TTTELAVFDYAGDMHNTPRIRPAQEIVIGTGFGITVHLDQRRYRYLVVVFTAEGRALFAWCKDRAGTPEVVRQAGLGGLVGQMGVPRCVRRFGGRPRRAPTSRAGGLTMVLDALAASLWHRLGHPSPRSPSMESGLPSPTGRGSPTRDPGTHTKRVGSTSARTSPSTLESCWPRSD